MSTDTWSSDDPHEEDATTVGQTGLFSFLDACAKYESALGETSDDISEEPADYVDDITEAEDKPTREATSRLARLTVNTFTPSGVIRVGGDGGNNTPTSSTPSLTDDDDSLEQQTRLREALNPIHVVDLLVEQFGAIHHHKEEPERLLFEADAAFFQVSV